MHLDEPQKLTFDLDSSQGDSIEYYSKSGKKKKKGKLLSKSKKGHSDVLSPSGKLSTKDHKKPLGNSKKNSGGKEKDPLLKKEKKRRKYLDPSGGRGLLHSNQGEETRTACEAPGTCWSLLGVRYATSKKE